MQTPEDARRYLEKALSGRDGGLKAASESVGKNHAYLQQYIRTGTPRWLPEPVREALVRAYGLDSDKLKPPPVALRPARTSTKAGRHGQDKGQVNAPRYGQIVDDPGQMELLKVWDSIRDPAMRDLAMVILRNMADRDSAAVA